jgi:hypothetical protein
VGIALVLSLFVMAALLTVTVGALLVSSTNILATRNYRGAGQVHFVAESGIAEALQVVNAVGVIHFQNDVVGQWPVLYGLSQRNFAPLPGFTYSVVPVAGPGAPAASGRFVVTANGPQREGNVVVATVTRSNVPVTAPGAVYLATDAPADATFNGNAFTIDGNDHNYTGGPGPGAPVPGIATRTDANTQEVLNSLSGQQRDNIQGLGYSSGPPISPSVAANPAAPSIAQMNQFIDDVLSRPGVVTNDTNRINGNAVFGTTASPQITHLTASELTIKGNGNVSGAGILIVEGDLTIQGNLEFKGLVLVRGRTSAGTDPETAITGNAMVYGSLWTQAMDFVAGGSAMAYYSSQALQLANQVGGGGALPAMLVVTSLADCAQLPPGAGGCP